MPYQNRNAVPLGYSSTSNFSENYAESKTLLNPEIFKTNQAIYRRGTFPYVEYRSTLPDYDYRKYIQMVGVPIIKKSSPAALHDAETFFLAVQMKRDELKLYKLHDYYPRLKYFVDLARANLHSRIIRYQAGNRFMMNHPLPQNRVLPEATKVYTAPAIKSIYRPLR
ncbi:hypothetical protein O3M35_003930 [Rhynocoris fuscipes]|uniref:Uncharacterized protein n=1 Tax=Rhynocoris fuscipes TaxID=488301 RepID=A0AAW1CHX6_9HEMI